jgi:hypothetical protein
MYKSVIDRYHPIVTAGLNAMRDHFGYGIYPATTIARSIAMRVCGWNGIHVKSNRLNEGYTLYDYSISGEYRSWEMEEDYDSHICIEVGEDGVLDLTDDTKWDKFLNEVRSTIVHEMTHRHQYEKRDGEMRKTEIFKSKSKNKDYALQENYLGSLDEIEAYSVDVAYEILLSGRKFDDVWNNFRHLNTKKFPTLGSYRLFFGTKTDHKVLNRLYNCAKKSYRYLSVLER